MDEHLAGVQLLDKDDGGLFLHLVGRLGNLVRYRFLVHVIKHDFVVVMVHLLRGKQCLLILMDVQGVEFVLSRIAASVRVFEIAVFRRNRVFSLSAALGVFLLVKGHVEVLGDLFIRCVVQTASN